MGTYGLVLHYDGEAWHSLNAETELTLNAVWGTSDTSVFAAGSRGTILYYDGSKWHVSDSGTTESLYGIWGTSGTNIYTVGSEGTLLHFNGAVWQSVSTGIDTAIAGIWGNSATDIFAVGANGMILHFNGTKWTSVQITPHWNFKCVRGNSGSDVYAAGLGVIMHFDGRKWRRIGGDGLSINSIWPDAGQFLAAGQSSYSKEGVIRKCEGSQCQDMSLPSTAPIKNLWASTAANIYAVGGDVSGGEVILHYNGQLWQTVWQSREDRAVHLRGVWGESEQNLFAAGDSGVILHFDGSRWEEIETPVSADLYSIWGRSGTDVTAVGRQGTVLHYDGAAWRVEESGTEEDLFKVWGGVLTPEGNEVLFAVGGGGEILFEKNQKWEPMESGVKTDLFGIGGQSFNDLFAVGDNDTILHFNGKNWSLEDVQTSGAGFYNVRISPPHSLLIVGAPNIIFQYDGLNWDNTGSVLDNRIPYDTWSRSDQEMYITLKKGIILYYNGSSWEQMDSGTDSTLDGIWGNTAQDKSPMTLFAVGENGTILNYTALTFVLQESVKEGETVKGEIIVRDAPDHDLTIQLEADRTDETVFPSSIVLPAGQTRTAFDLTADDDSLLDGSQTVILSASADGMNPGQFTLQVNDNETASLSVTFPGELVEGDGLLEGKGLVTLDSAADKDVVVSLRNNDVNAVRIPHTIVIKTGEKSASFDLLVVDDQEINDLRRSTIEAAVEGWQSGEVAVSVMDNDRYGIFLNLPESISEADGVQSGAGEVFVSESFETDIPVHLSSSDPSEMNVPETVVIPAGQKSEFFDLLPVEDMLVDNVQTVSVITAARGFLGDEAEIQVSDADGRWKIQRFGTSNIRGLWGDASDSIFAVGWYGCIFHYDGKQWKRMESTLEYDGSSAHLRGIWGNGDEDVFAVGNYGTVIHYDGQQWHKMENRSDAVLYGVWGTSGTNVFAVGDEDRQGVILHYDGLNWQTLDADLKERLTGIWGASAQDIFAVGYDGCILHYDGNEWTQMESGTDENLRSVWGSSGTDVYAVTSDLILHYDGAAWRPLPEGKDKTLYTVWGTGKDNVFIGGYKGLMLHFNGQEWTEIHSDSSESIWALWGASENEVFGAGTAGMICRYDGTDCQVQKKIDPDLNDIWGIKNEFGIGDIIYIVGEDGIILQCSGTDCVQMERGFFPELNGLWGRSESEIYAVGNEGVILKYNGERWRSMQNSVEVQLNDVWGTPPDAENSAVFAVGDDGIILHYNGLEWQPLLSGVSADLESIWGVKTKDGQDYELFAAGEDGTILQFKGSQWQTMESGTSEDLLSVWGTGPENLYAVGQRGTFLRYDGLDWQKAWDLSSSSLKHIWGRSENDFFVIEYSRIFHFDGFQWTHFTTPAVQLNSLWQNSLGDALAAGWYNTLYSFSPVRLTLPEQAAENTPLPGKSGCVTIDAPRETDTSVRLAAHHPVLSVPEEVFIPAGETSACFDISIHDDALLNGSRRIPVTASVSGYQLGTEFIEVQDDETAVISLDLPDSVKEGDTVSDGQCSVSLDKKTDEDVYVQLASAAPEAVRIPDHIIIPQGESSAAFDLTIADDPFFNGLRSIEISASVAGWLSASALAAVTDDETYDLLFDLPETAAESAGIISASLSIPGILDTDLTVSLSSDDVSEITLPETAVIPAGKTEVSVSLTVVDDPDIDGSQSVTVRAEAPGWTAAEHQLSITDNDPGEIQFSSERFMAWETDGNAEIEVIRSRSLNGSVSIDYTTADREAVNGVDYVSVTGTLTFEDGESRKTFTVPLLTTSHIENSKTLGLQLVSPADGVSAGAVQEAELVIVDQAAWQPSLNVQDSSFTDIWGSGSGHAVAVGWHGLVYIYDGSEWSDKSKGIGSNVYLESVWGRSENDIYIAGQVGQTGTVFHYDGDKFSSMEKNGRGQLYDIWGAPDGSVIFAVGSNGIYRHDSGVWQPDGPSELPTLRSIWGRSAEDVFVVGDEGIIYHYDGSAWQKMESGTDAHLYAVWADTRSRTAFAAGAFGTLLKYNGREWHPEALPAANILFLNALWGSNASDVFAAGYNGAVFHYNGNEWQAADSRTSYTVNALWGPGGGAALSVFAVDEGGQILHYGPAE